MRPIYVIDKFKETTEKLIQVIWLVCFTNWFPLQVVCVVENTIFNYQYCVHMCMIFIYTHVGMYI